MKAPNAAALSPAPDFKGGEEESVLVAAPALIELLPVATYACEIGGRLRWFNRRAAEIWGRTPAIGDDSERFCGSFRLYDLDGNLTRREESPMAQTLRTGESVHGREVMVERPDGARCVAMAHVNPIHDRGGNLIGAIGCFDDVTESKQEHRQLRRSEREIRELLDALPAAIYTTDAQGRITFYNEAAVELSGRRPTLGADEWCVTWRLYAPDGTPMPHDQCPMAVALREDRAVRGIEAVAERPDGTLVPFIPYPTPLHDASGALIGAVNMLVDIRHRKDAETQQRLMFSELNHRIKNNMQMLHGLLNAARRETRSPQARAALADTVQRIGAMASAQKVLYRAGDADRYDAGEFIASVCENASHAFGPAVTITCKAQAADLGNDTATPLALIVNELTTNAAKHALGAGGEAAIEVSLTRQGDTVTLEVADNGPGFDLRPSRARTSGLGLVAGLARQLDGELRVERADGARCIVSFHDARDAHG